MPHFLSAVVYSLFFYGTSAIYFKLLGMNFNVKNVVFQLGPIWAQVAKEKLRYLANEKFTNVSCSEAKIPMNFGYKRSNACL